MEYAPLIEAARAATTTRGRRGVMSAGFRLDRSEEARVIESYLGLGRRGDP